MENLSRSTPEPCTRLKCGWCGGIVEPQPRNASKQRFCHDQCRTSWHNSQKTNGAAMIKNKSQKKPRLPRKPQRLMDLDGIAPQEQAELLANMALEVGVTDGPVVTAARYAAMTIALRRERGLPFKSRQECRGIIRAAADPIQKAKLEAMFDVMETEKCFG